MSSEHMSCHHTHNGMYRTGLVWNVGTLCPPLPQVKWRRKWVISNTPSPFLVPLQQQKKAVFWQTTTVQTSIWEKQNSSSWQKSFTNFWKNHVTIKGFVSWIKLIQAQSLERNLFFSSFWTMNTLKEPIFARNHFFLFKNGFFVLYRKKPMVGVGRSTSWDEFDEGGYHLSWWSVPSPNLMSEGPPSRKLAFPYLYA